MSPLAQKKPPPKSRAVFLSGIKLALVVCRFRMLGGVEAHDFVFFFHPQADGFVDDEGDGQGDGGEGHDGVSKEEIGIN